MTIEREYLELFSERVTIVPSTGSLSLYGRRTFTASLAVTACAHLVAEERLFRTSDGRTIVETGRVYVYGLPTVTTDHMLILGSGSASTSAASPVIIGVDVPHDQDGAHHTVIRMGS